MTFINKELSVEDGKPVDLIEFSYGGVTDYYTNSQTTVVNINAYEPLGFEKNDMYYSDDRFDSDLKIVVPIDHKIALFYRTIVPTQTYWVKVKRLHLTDTVDNEVVTIWTGRIRGVDFHNVTATIICDPLSTILDRKGLRYTAQRSCNHTLYGAHCSVNSVTFREVGDIVTINGNVITVAEAASRPAGHFKAGFVTNVGGSEQQMITDHTGSSITLRYPLVTFSVGDSIILNAGCDRSLATCRDKFDNELFYGGVPNSPLRNVFTQGLF